VKRATSLFVVVVVLMCILALPAVGQESQGLAEPGCAWYWGNKWSSAGEWENWCWDPQKGGWWYATNEDGTKQYYHYS
jgi:hypothetical protein